MKNHRISIVRIWPKAEEITAPEHIAENLDNYFKQASKALKVESWDAAAIMFRKVLDVATKILKPDSSKLNLIKRIESLRSDNVLTESLADWAHEIRIEGNEAAHEDSPYTRSDAEALRDFCEYFLIYAFTLPRRIELRRHPAEEK